MQAPQPSQQQQERLNYFAPSEFGLTYTHMTWITGVALVLLGLFVGGVSFQLSNTQKKFQAIQTQIQQQQNGTNKAQEEAGNPILKVSGVLLRQPPWPDLFFAISQSLTDGIWLESITGKKEKSGDQILITGTAHQAGLVPRVLDRLRSSKRFARVQLISTEASGNIDAPFRFQLKGTIK